MTADAQQWLDRSTEAVHMTANPPDNEAGLMQWIAAVALSAAAAIGTAVLSMSASDDTVPERPAAPVAAGPINPSELDSGRIVVEPDSSPFAIAGHRP